MAGQGHFRSERDSGRSSPVRSRRLLSLAVVFAAMVIAPRVSQADFIADSGLNASGLLPRSSAVAQDASLLEVVFERIGCGSTSQAQESAPQQKSPTKTR